MRALKRLTITILCAILSKLAQAQVHLPDTIYMFTNYEKLYLDSNPNGGLDTLYARNYNGVFEEKAFLLTDKEEKELYDYLSMCRNRDTPVQVKLIRIGHNFFRIGERIMVKMDERTLKAFANSFEHPRHCDHASHASHMSQFSPTRRPSPSTDWHFSHSSHSSHSSHYSSTFHTSHMSHSSHYSSIF